MIYDSGLLFWATLYMKQLLNNKNFFYFDIFSFFLVFKHDFIRCVDFIHMAASNTTSDDVTN